MHPQGWHTIEEKVWLADSALWARNRAWYVDAGSTAWNRVPFYVTSSAATARAYARILYRFLQDCGRRRGGDPAVPVTILELGAGSGRLAFGVLWHLDALVRHGPSVPPYRYLLTDIDEARVRGLLARPELQPFVDAGLVDGAVYDAMLGGPIETFMGNRLDAMAQPNPMFVIANYVFDALPQDMFRMRNGRPVRQHCTLQEPEAGAAPERLRLRFTDGPDDPMPYDEFELDTLLAMLSAGRRDGESWLLPTGALTALRHLEVLSGGAMFALIADAPPSPSAPFAALHGSVSLTVDDVAIARAMALRGAHCARFGGDSHGLSFATIRWGSFPEAQLEATAQLGERSPMDAFGLERRLGADGPALLRLLRAGGWDPQLVAWLSTPLVEWAPASKGSQRQELLAGLARSLSLLFPVGTQDLSAGLARVCFAVGAYRDAAALFAQSMDVHGASADRLQGLAVCLAAVGDAGPARRHLADALSLDPTHAPALRAIAQLSKEA